MTKHIIYTILIVPNLTNIKFDTERGNSMNSKVWGYCRISTQSQSIDRQVRNIKAEYPKAIIVKEVFTGTETESRKELGRLLREVKAGDTIVFDSVSRLSRDADTGFKIYKDLFDKGINLVFLKEGYINTEVYKSTLENTNTVQVQDELLDNTILKGIRKYLMKLAEQQIKIAFEQAEKEVQDLRQRTREGIETARLEGKQIGQVEGAKLTIKKSIKAKEVILKHSKDFEGTLQDDDVMKLAEVSRNTYYKYKRQLKESEVIDNE